MTKVKYFTKSGKAGRDLNLNLKLRSSSDYQSLLHQVFRVEQMSRLFATAKSKTRAERKGGGKKPWRQKGTGRARAGSLRSPLFRKGGVVFGPKSNRNFKRKLPRKARELAKAVAISDRIANKAFFVFAEIPELKKTKEAEKWLLKFPLKEGKILLILSAREKKAFNNLPYLKIRSRGNFTFSDLIVADYILMERDVFEKMKERLEKTKVS